MTGVLMASAGVPLEALDPDWPSRSAVVASVFINLKQRHLLENPVMAAQAALPEGGLGRPYAEQLKRLNLTPESLIEPRPITTAAEYLPRRLRETHDSVHVLTGFGIDGPGELGLPESPLL